jgi:polysaccharide pyruvyl transferase WcaK-like protein
MKNIYSNLKIFRFGTELLEFKTSKRIFITGNFGAMNLGDESILAGQIFEIRRVQKNASIFVAARFPELIRKMHGKKVHAVNIKNPFSIFLQVLGSEIILVGGGGLFCKAFEPVSGVIYQIYFALLFLALPILLRKKVFVLGIGIYRNMYPFNLNLVVNLLKLANKVTVRDVHSFELLKEKGIDVELYKDNCYLMPVLPKGKIIKRVLGNKFRSGKTNIGIAVRLPFESSRRDIFIDSLVEYISKNGKSHFWFYNLDGHSNKVNDELINNKVIKKLGGPKENISIIGNSKHPSIIFSTFKYMDYFIAMRLHSMIFSDRLGVPYDGVSYDVKCATFLTSVGKKSLPIKKGLAGIFKQKFTK